MTQNTLKLMGDGGGKRLRRDDGMSLSCSGSNLEDFKII